MKSLWCLQYSNKLNGGNQALDALYSELVQQDNKTHFLRGSVLDKLKILTQHRMSWVIVSDPFCSIILFYLGFQRVIHFVQSDDYNLFYERSLIFNYFYRKVYSFLAKKSRWKRVFNSDYSRIKFNSRFNKQYQKDTVVPMLGLSGLFPVKHRPIEIDNDHRSGNVLWVGSSHTFKGGELFIKVVNQLAINGTMVFGGRVPSWALGVNGVEVKSNLDRSDVSELMKSSKCYVYTSQFDSFGLPMYEALYAGCPVIAIENECIELNKTSSFVRVVENEDQLVQLLLSIDSGKAPLLHTLNWQAERKAFLEWVAVNMKQ